MAVEVGLHHVSGEESALAGALIELAERQGVPWVVPTIPRYVDGGSRLVHDLLTALRADLDLDTAASWGVLHPNGEWRLKSPAEMGRCGRAGRRGWWSRPGSRRSARSTCAGSGRRCRSSRSPVAMTTAHGCGS
jgi:hypothetical protein